MFLKRKELRAYKIVVKKKSAQPFILNGIPDLNLTKLKVCLIH